MPINYGSVCSGIEAATVAWHPLNWRAEWYAEIEPFPSAVLAHHYLCHDVPYVGHEPCLHSWPAWALRSGAAHDLRQVVEFS